MHRDREMEELQNALADSTRSLKGATELVLTLQRDLQIRKSANLEQSETIARLETKLRMQNDQLSSETKKNKELSGELMNLKYQMQAVMGEREGLKQQNMTLSHQLDELKALYQQSDQSLASIQDKFDSNEAERKSATATIRVLEGQVATLNRELADTKNQLNVATANLERARNELSQVAAKINEKNDLEREVLKRVKLELEQTRVELQRLKSFSAAQNDEIQSLQKSIANKSSEASQLSSELIQTRNELARQQESAELSQDLQRTKEELLNTTAQLSRYLSQNQALLNYASGRAATDGGQQTAGTPEREPQPRRERSAPPPPPQDVPMGGSAADAAGGAQLADREPAGWLRGRSAASDGQGLYDSTPLSGSAPFTSQPGMYSGYSTPHYNQQQQQTYGGQDSSRRYSAGEDNRILDASHPGPTLQSPRGAWPLGSRPPSVPTRRTPDPQLGPPAGWRGSPGGYPAVGLGPRNSGASPRGGGIMRLELTAEELFRAGLNPDQEISV